MERTAHHSPPLKQKGPKLQRNSNVESPSAVHTISAYECTHYTQTCTFRKSNKWMSWKGNNNRRKGRKKNIGWELNIRPFTRSFWMAAKGWENEQEHVEHEQRTVLTVKNQNRCEPTKKNTSNRSEQNIKCMVRGWYIIVFCGNFFIPSSFHIQIHTYTFYSHKMVVLFCMCVHYPDVYGRVFMLEFVNVYVCAFACI